MVELTKDKEVKMTEEQLNELNKEMLKFAGFTLKDTGGVLLPGRRKSEYAMFWPPYFPTDINACFKWLLPSLIEYQVKFEWTLGGLVSAWTIEECTENIKRNVYYSNKESPALALCLAILELSKEE